MRCMDTRVEKVHCSFHFFPQFLQRFFHLKFQSPHFLDATRNLAVGRWERPGAWQIKRIAEGTCCYPGIEFRRSGDNGSARFSSRTADGKSHFALVALDGANAFAQIAGDVLPAARNFGGSAFLFPTAIRTSTKGKWEAPCVV